MDSLAVRKVRLDYEEERILDDITFALKKGETYGLIGKNGAGKTSLLSLLAAFRLPTAGSILADGKDPFERMECTTDTMFVYENDMSEETVKVRSYIEIFARYRKSFDMTYAETLAARFSLPLDKKVNELSKGGRAALAIIIGLAAKASLTLFDEPHLGLDAIARESFYEELLWAQKDHPRIFVLATCLLDEASHLFDRLLILQEGKLRFDEATDTFLQRAVKVTGPKEAVLKIGKNHEELACKELGDTRQALLFSHTGPFKAKETPGVRVERPTLQEVFIHLTREGSS